MAGVMTDPDPAAAAWLSEMWPPCRELPLGERLEKRVQDAARQALLHSQEVDSAPESVEKRAS